MQSGAGLPKENEKGNKHVSSSRRPFHPCPRRLLPAGFSGGGSGASFSTARPARTWRPLHSSHALGLACSVRFWLAISRFAAFDGLGRGWPGPRLVAQPLHGRDALPCHGHMRSTWQGRSGCQRQWPEDVPEGIDGPLGLAAQSTLPRLAERLHAIPTESARTRPADERRKTCAHPRLLHQPNRGAIEQRWGGNDTEYRLRSGLAPAVCDAAAGGEPWRRAAQGATCAIGLVLATDGAPVAIRCAHPLFRDPWTTLWPPLGPWSPSRMLRQELFAAMRLSRDAAGRPTERPAERRPVTANPHVYRLTVFVVSNVD